jgi:methylmalonyl-CoA/ethylmalonyl-CoA epimerase
VTIGVPDLSAAVADWSERLGWPPAASSTEGATFALDDSYVELVPAGDDNPGVRLVSVVVDDIDEVADRLKEEQASLSVSPEGRVAIEPAAVNGVPMELRPEDGESDAGVASRLARGPYRRINHIIVAVADDEAAKASWARLFGAWSQPAAQTDEVAHHVPVGIAWFGLTGAGTDASALARFVERRGEGVYGLALVVDDHQATLAALEAHGAQIVRQASSGQTFVHPRTSHGMLIDLMPERHPSRLG